MRHITGFFLALVMSAALFFGGGWGIARFIAIRNGRGLQAWPALEHVNNMLPIAAVLGTGLLLGILLVVRRVSALATGVPGLVLLGWSALLIMRGNYALTFVPLPGTHYAAGFSAMLFSGALALLGAVMIVPLFMPSRWRRAMVEIEDLSDDDYSVHAALGLAP